ncbi:sensor histidine kinase [Angustibacter sp. McL0619]|uniref:sensor histidine kinase n=1 Tax=Angustibacter sp. McL0619 TaxID=3415676 RepID=UPI003CF5B6B0
MLRSALIAAAVGVLLVGVPLLGLGAWTVTRQTESDLSRRAMVLQLLVAGSTAPLPELAGQVELLLGQGRNAGHLHARISSPDGVLDVGTAPTGQVIRRSVSQDDVMVAVDIERSVLNWEVAEFGLVILGLSLVAFGVATLSALWQARRLVEPLEVLADNADRLGRGESRLRPVSSGVAELDRVAEGLERSAASMTAALAAEREFASDASHQLRTPLTALSMRLEEIATSEEVDEVHEEARVALNQVERLTQVVDSLLARSRLQRRATVTSVNLGELLDQQVEEWTPAFRERRRRLVLHPLEKISVVATPGALSQVMATLVENSLQHGRGTVSITARRTGRSVVVEVTDEGEGVPPSLGSRIFERSVSSSGSTGLGLALARDLAEADGGRLELVRARPPVFAVFLSAVD